MFDVYCIPLVNLEKTLYHSVTIISGFEAALIVPQFSASFLGVPCYNTVSHLLVVCVLFGADWIDYYHA